MLCSVTLLRRHGRRLKQPELEAPVFGDLLLRDHDTKVFRRQVQAARLFGPARGTLAPAELLIPIFDAKVVNIGPTSMAISGIELEAVGGAESVSEHIQVWWVQHIGATSLSAPA